MKRLTKQERVFIDQILVNLPIKARSDYLAYRQKGGRKLRTIHEYDIAYELYLKGWLADEPDMLCEEPIYLKPEAWRLFALDEWVELEERIIDKKRGDLSGSW